jgi:hypothetical protein
LFSGRLRSAELLYLLLLLRKLIRLFRVVQCWTLALALFSFAWDWFLFFCNALLFSLLLFSSRLPGGGITFFAAAKKVIKESSFSTTPKAHSR